MADLPPTFVTGFHDADIVRRMKYQRLGNTDLIVSRLSLGCGGLSNGEFLCAKDLVHAAVKSGINYIDTSPYYGAGKSELVLGQALIGLPRSSYYLATKVGRTEHCEFKYGAEEVRRSVVNSLNKLGVQYIDVMQVHDVEFSDVETVVRRTLPALEQLRKEGLIKWIGITGYPVTALRQVVEQAAADPSIHIDVVLSYCRHTLFNNDLLQHTEFFRQHGMGMINAAVHGMGLLTGTDLEMLKESHPATPHVRAACKHALTICREEGVNLAKITMADALASPHVHTVLTGMADTGILQANISVLVNGLTEKEQQVLDRVKRECMTGMQDGGHWEGIELQSYRSDPDAFCHKLRNRRRNPPTGVTKA